MFKYTPKHRLKVEGKMNAHDAGIVGRRLALAANICALGVLLAGVAAVLKVAL
ncbi:hypothetical protein [Burkholderia sp. MSMB0856]|uniref:hypothetical protein n=1 Tax=Burkholderia sp. MSMB0856 TaxID=1637869 RepID=UPI0015D02A97|nr:hypothetical protein [Burkholderia sp. MSMB0856]